MKVLRTMPSGGPSTRPPWNQTRPGPHGLTNGTNGGSSGCPSELDAHALYLCPAPSATNAPLGAPVERGAGAEERRRLCLPVGRGVPYREELAVGMGGQNVVVGVLEGTVCRLMDTTAERPLCTLNGLVDGLMAAPPRCRDVVDAKLPPM